MRTARNGSLLTLLLILVGPPASPAGLLKVDASAVEVVVRLLGTTPEGPTQIVGVASTILGVGELGALDIAAGVVSDTAPRCAITTLSGRSVPPPLVGPGYRWRVLAELEETRGDRFHLRLDWSRQGRHPDGRDAAAGEELRVRLAAGERRHLDHADFVPLEGDGSCSFDALALEIEPQLRVGNPAFAGRDLDFEVWFTRSAGGKREEFTRMRMAAAQGERLNFQVEPLTTELDLGAGSRGRLRTGGRGTLTGWYTGRDTVAIRFEAIIQHRFDPGGVRVSSGEGSKLYEARLGETVEIELPPLYATLIVPVKSLELSGSPAEGIEIEGDTARVSLRTLAGAGGYSLLLRVTDPD